MKIVSLIFFAVALSGTWMAAHAKRAVGQSVHVDIQNDLKRIISEYVQKNLPNAKNLRFEKFWTETVKKNQIKALFVYTFEDVTESGEPATIEIAGSATLNKVNEANDVSTWSFDELRILDNKVTFEEPVQITAGGDTGEGEPEAEAQPTPSAAPTEEKPAANGH